MRLRRTQKNALFEQISGSGLQANDFTLNSTGDVTRLTHHPTESCFNILYDDQGLFIQYSIDQPISRETFRGPLTWPEVLNQFYFWTAAVKEENDAPDMWAELAQAGEFVTDSTIGELANTPFTATEHEQIDAQLQEIKDYITKTCSLSIEQAARVEASLEQVKAASRRMGRKDWLLIFTGTMFTLIITSVLSPDIVQHILSMIATSLGHLFGGMIPPPQLPPQT